MPAVGVMWGATLYLSAPHTRQGVSVQVYAGWAYLFRPKFSHVRGHVRPLTDLLRVHV